MARLFIRHEPVACTVEDSVNEGVFYVHISEFSAHKILIAKFSMDYVYVCFVHKGSCWAARSSAVMGNKQVRFQCVPFNDDPSGQKMILADMILN